MKVPTKSRHFESPAAGSGRVHPISFGPSPELIGDTAEFGTPPAASGNNFTLRQQTNLIQTVITRLVFFKMKGEDRIDPETGMHETRLLCAMMVVNAKTVLPAHLVFNSVVISLVFKDTSGTAFKGLL